MRRTTISSIGFSLLSIATTLVCQAQPQNTGFYLKGGVGPAIVEDADLKSFPGVPGTPKVKFDPGVRFDIGGGYQVNDWFAAEFDTGMAHNSIDSISGASEDEAWVINVPFMANAVFRCPRLSQFVPYVGVGAGFSSTILDVDEITIGSTTVFGGSESDVVFAYQGFVGFRYHLDDRWSIGAEYKYLATDDASWKVRSISPGGATERIRLDNLHTHSIIASFTFSF